MKRLFVAPDPGTDEFAIALLDTEANVSELEIKAMRKWIHRSWRWMFNDNIKDWSKVIGVCTRGAGRKCCHNLYIVPSYRGQDLGNFMYDKVEKHFGFKLRPARIQTKSGVEFWKRRQERNRGK